MDTDINEELHTELVDLIEKIKATASSISTVEMINVSALFLRQRFEVQISTNKLQAPSRQAFFFLSQGLMTPEPDEPEVLQKLAVDELRESLNRTYEIYGLMFFPSQEDSEGLPESWYEERRVLMPYFLDYHTSGVQASVEQISERILEISSPFEEITTRTVGLTGEEFLLGCTTIVDSLNANTDLLLTLHQQLQKPLETWRQAPDAAPNTEATETVSQLVDGMNQLHRVDVTSLEISLGPEKTKLFLNAFTSEREEKSEDLYPTERYPAEAKPLVLDKEGHVYCPSTNQLYNAVLEYIESLLKKSDVRQSYFKNRDEQLERRVASQFQRLLGTEHTLVTNGFETASNQFEHDLVILHDGTLFAVEAKATPSREPFRDPERAYPRVRDQFRSDTGPQKGFEQAERIRSQSAQDEPIELYDGHGELVLRIPTGTISEAFSICVTRDSYGPLATSLDGLLEKETTVPYPWIVNVLDLESLITGFMHLGLQIDDLKLYIKQRILLHGKVFGSDELEFAGYFVQHGDLSSLINHTADFIQLNPNYSDVFDDIWLAEKNGETIKRQVSDPVILKVGGRLMAMPTPSVVSKSARNQTSDSRVIALNAKKKKKGKKKQTKKSRRSNRKRK